MRRFGGSLLMPAFLNAVSISGIETVHICVTQSLSIAFGGTTPGWSAGAGCPGAGGGTIRERPNFTSEYFGCGGTGSAAIFTMAPGGCC